MILRFSDTLFCYWHTKFNDKARGSGYGTQWQPPRGEKREVYTEPNLYVTKVRPGFYIPLVKNVTPEMLIVFMNPYTWYQLYIAYYLRE